MRTGLLHITSCPPKYSGGCKSSERKETPLRVTGLWHRELIVLLFVGPLLAASPAYGAFAPYSLSCQERGSVKANYHSSVRMDRQKVTLRLKKGAYEVDATFHFFNTGSTVTEEVCFPPKFLFTRYDTWIDSRRTNWVHPEPPRHHGLLDVVRGLFSESDFGVPRCLVQRVTFPPNRQTVIRMRYERKYTPDPLGPAADFRYGTCWQGSIAETIVTINATDIGGVRNCSIAGYISDLEKVTTDNTIELSLTNAKPDMFSDVVVYPIPNVKDRIY